MVVRFYLKEPKEKESLIIARVLWQNFQLPYSTKRKIETKYWVKENKKGEPVQKVMETSKYPKFSEVNQSLSNVRNDIEQVFIRFVNENRQQEPSPTVLKELLDRFYNRGKSKVREVKPVSFIQFFKDFITRSEKGVRINRANGQALSPNTISTYNTTLKHLELYNKQVEKGLNWEDINLKFHEDYTEFLMNEYDLSNNSLGKDFQIIKLFCSEAYYAGVNLFDKFKDPMFSVSREESFAVHLNDQEINLLWNLDLSNNLNHEQTRDLFVLGCVTGLRYSDYSNIKPSQIIGNKLHVKQVKNGKKLEVSLISPMADAIVKKYNGVLPKGHVNQVFNRYLKDICEKIPGLKEIIEIPYSKGGKKLVQSKQKYELIKSHTGRRSFASNEVEKGTPIPVIMAATGHTTEKSFWKYVKLSKSLYADMYSEILMKRHKLKAV